MNLGQLSEGTVGKNVMYCDRYIKDNPGRTIETISWLNEKIIKNLNDPIYYKDVDNLIKQLKVDKIKRTQFIDAINATNLFIEAPQFTETDINGILNNGVNPNETVLIKKETIKYFKQKLKVDIDFPEEDCEIPHVFCCPLYIMKLYKLTKHICTARDFGPVRQVTKQPLKGRARSGGSRIGRYWPSCIVIYDRNPSNSGNTLTDYAEGNPERSLFKFAA